MKVSGWGRFPVVEATVARARSVDDVAAAVAAGPVTLRGLGRSYGDSSLGPRMLDLTGLDAFLGFDEETGLLTCEAGVSLASIVEVLLPRGWFLPVTPGTRFVTVGGAIASDVHGKNHHVAGSFSDHVSALTLMLAGGEVLEVSRSRHPELFHATCGGMGLTGVVLAATVQLVRVGSGQVHEQVIRTGSLTGTVEAFAAHSGATYSVAWIDLVARGRSLGRSLVMLGEHAAAGDLASRQEARRAAVPVDLPGALLNRASVRAFNALYYGRIRDPQLHRTVPLERFFYPLDRIAGWNRAYGRRGFLQHQCVLPLDGGPDLLHDVVDRVAAAGLASPLAVLKVLGPANDNHLGFAVPGFTLTVDLRAGPRALALCEELDLLVVRAGGRVYLTKDSRMSAETFRACYPRVEEFEEVRRSYGAAGVFVSEQSKRLGLA